MILYGLPGYLFHPLFFRYEIFDTDIDLILLMNAAIN